MKHVQVNLGEAQLLVLRERATQSGRSLADLVREAVSVWIEQEERRRGIDRALASIGGFHSGLGDLAEKHDLYLDDAAGR